MCTCVESGVCVYMYVQCVCVEYVCIGCRVDMYF